LSKAGARRALRAAAAFHEFSPSCVIASGGRRWHGVSEADALSRALVSSSVPKDAIVRELCSLSTLENAWYSAEILRIAGLHRPGIVTCDWHMSRAIACFERAGVEAIAIPAPAPLGLATRLTRSATETAKLWLDRQVSAHWVDP
jgi:uncharacterized SAM-binding protein YcdF (DUF218 family)